MSVKYYSNGETIDVSDLRIKSTSDYNEVSCTAAEYEAIDPHDEKTIYIVTYPDGSITKYLGDDEIGGEEKYDYMETIKAIVQGTDTATLTMPDDITSIKQRLFFYTPKSQFKTVIAPNVELVQTYAFHENAALESFRSNELTEIESYAFLNCTKLTDIDLSKATIIRQNAFNGAPLSTELLLDDLVTLEQYAFYYPTSSTPSALKKVRLKEILTIPGYCFAGRTNLEEVDIGKATQIQYAAFGNCSSLTNIDISNVTTVANQAFEYCTSLESVDLSSLTSALAAQTFRGCTSLRSVGTPSNFRINDSAFYGCTALTDDSIDFSKVTNIATNAFYGCTGFTKIKLTAITTTIGIYAFQNCSNLEKLIISRSTSSNYVANNSFANCTSLTALVLDTPFNAGAANMGLASTPIGSGTGYIYVPSSLIDTYKAAANWSAFADQFRAIEDYPDIVN